MVNKIVGMNNALIQEQPPANEKGDKPIEKAQNILANPPEKAEKSLADHCIKVLKDFFGAIFNCFCKCFKKDNYEEIKIEQKPKIEDKNDAVRISRAEVQKAIDLMFGVEWGVWQDLTDEQKNKRYMDLKKAIEKILPEHINSIVNYRVGMASYATNLLLHAITKINDPAHRLEIVKILLDKGADPRVPGFYYKEIEILKEAVKIGDELLLDLLRKAAPEIPARIEELKKLQQEKVKKPRQLF